MPSNLYIDTVFAVDGDRTAVPDPTQGSGVVSYQQGYSIAYSTSVASGGYDFPRNQHNQILYDITAAIQNMQQNGAAYFITSAMNGGSAFSYILGAIAAYDAGSGLQVWISTAAANTTVPGAEGANWLPLTAPSSPLFIGGTSTGSANAQAIVTNQGNYANTAGNIVTFKAGISNTGAATLSVDTVSNIPLKKASQSGVAALIQGDIIIGLEYIAISDGTNLQVLNPSGSSLSSPSTADFSKLKIIWGSTTALTATANSLTLQNSAGATIKLTSYSESVATGTSGAGGLSTGSIADNTWYAVYAIYNPTIPAASIIIDPSFTAPTLPSGYSYSALIGACLTDGSAHLIGFLQLGCEWRYQVGNNLTGLPVMASGSAGSVSTPTYVSTSVASFVPTAVAAKIIGDLNWQAGGGWAIVSPNNSYGAYNSTTNPPLMSQGNGTDTTTTPFEFLLESSDIYYASGTSAVYVSCYGFTLNL